MPVKRVARLNPRKSEVPVALRNGTPVTFLPMARVGSDGTFNASEVVPIEDVWDGFTYFRRSDVILAKITPCFENGKGASLDCLPTDWGFGSTEFIVLRPSQRVHSQFLHALVSLSVFRRLGAEFMQGASGQQRVPTEFVANFRFPVPPARQQLTILRFIKHVELRVQQFIAARECQVSLLEEERKAIIHRAVTRGLDLDVPLKSSGVAWLGQVPAHWRVVALKRAVHRIIDCEHKTAPSVDSSDFRVVRTSAVRAGRFIGDGTYSTDGKSFDEWTRRGAPVSGDVLFTREAPAGEACLVPAEGKYCLGQRMVLLKPDPTRCPARFLVFSIYGGAIRQEIENASRGSTVAHFNVDDIGRLLLVLPPIEEARKIVDLTSAHLADTDEAIGGAQRHIALLREFRTRLISDVITGKFDVREAAASLQDDPDADDPALDEQLEEVVAG